MEWGTRGTRRRREHKRGRRRRRDRGALLPSCSADLCSACSHQAAARRAEGPASRGGWQQPFHMWRPMTPAPRPHRPAAHLDAAALLASASSSSAKAPARRMGVWRPLAPCSVRLRDSGCHAAPAAPLLVLKDDLGRDCSPCAKDLRVRPAKRAPEAVPFTTARRMSARQECAKGRSACCVNLARPRCRRHRLSVPSVLQRAGSPKKE